MQAIDREIKPEFYDVVHVDLNEDGAQDVLAFMNGKSGYCGSGGCTLFILAAAQKGLTKIGAVKIVNRPIFLRKSSHHGFRDLLVTVRGGGASPGLVPLVFDGASYPIAPGEGLVFAETADSVLFGEAPAFFEAKQSLQGITFSITSEGGKVIITPSGLEIDNRPISADINGTVKGVEVGDINGDGSPEVYVYTTETTGQKRGSLIAYSTNKKKSLSAIFLPELAGKESVGYRGQDEFAVVEGIIGRRFPIFSDDPTKAEPTGKYRQLQYKLIAGEAGWVLRLDKVVEF